MWARIDKETFFDLLIKSAFELETLKRYWLFVWPKHEAEGGMEDFRSRHNTLMDAQRAYIPSVREDKPNTTTDMAHIYDVEQHKIISRCFNGEWENDKPRN